MEVDWDWAVAAGRTGVYFTSAPGNTGLTPPGAQIKAILPDGSEVFPILEPADERNDLGGFGFVFDPPLPDGAVVHENNAPSTRSVAPVNDRHHEPRPISHLEAFFDPSV